MSAGDAFDRLAAPIEASTLRLVTLTERHLGALDHAFRSDPELWEWTIDAEPRTQADTVAWLERAMHEHTMRTRSPFAIELPDGTLAGTTSYFDIRSYDGALEIGHTLVFKRHRRTQVNTAAKLALLTRAFETGFERVAFQTDARNARSRAAIERLGAAYEGTMRSSRRRHDGTLGDTVIYSIVASEWPQVRTRLQTSPA